MVELRRGRREERKVMILAKERVVTSPFKYNDRFPPPYFIYFCQASKSEEKKTRTHVIWE